MDRVHDLHGWFLVMGVCLTLIIAVDATHFNGNVIIRAVVGDAPAYDASHIEQYVLFFGNYDGNADYNRARATCQAIGGDLAKIETVAKRNWIGSLDVAFFAADIWTGLTENVAGSPRWAPGCQPAVSSLTSGDDWVSNKRCLRLQNNGAGSFNYDHRDCTDNFDFMCETYSVVNVTDCDVHPNFTSSNIPADDCVTTTTSTTTTTQTTTTTPSTSPSSSTTVSTWSTTPAEDCGDCFCVLTANITTQEAQVIADKLSKNLTVDAKSTSAYRRTLESAEDHRLSAKAVGFVGIIIIILPFGVLVLSDVKTMIQSVRNIRNVYKF